MCFCGINDIFASKSEKISSKCLQEFLALYIFESSEQHRTVVLLYDSDNLKAKPLNLFIVLFKEELLNLF
jgi:hypothetical protein